MRFDPSRRRRYRRCSDSDSRVGARHAICHLAVKSRVDGELERALFNEGDELKRGDTMLVIDSSLPESALRQAEANLRRDEALIASAEAEAHRNELLFK